jgi:hypothetical protein
LIETSVADAQLPPLSQGDGKPLDNEPRLLSQRDGKPEFRLPLSQADGKPSEVERPLSQSDGKPSSSHTAPGDQLHNAVKLERASTPLWEYPGRPLDSQPNDRLITVKTKVDGEVKILPSRYRHATYNGPTLDDDDYDSDELLELETGNVKNVTTMRPDPFGIMPPKSSKIMTSGTEAMLRRILHTARFARPACTKAAREKMAPLNYESTVQMSAAFLPPS